MCYLLHPHKQQMIASELLKKGRINLQERWSSQAVSFSGSMKDKPVD
jgi:hypothetical protein